MCLPSARSCSRCVTGQPCSTYCAGAQDPCEHAFGWCVPLTRHLHRQSCLPAQGWWEKGPDTFLGTAGSPQSWGKQQELGPSQAALQKKMAIVAEVTFCKQISLQRGQLHAVMRVIRPSPASGGSPQPHTQCAGWDEEAGASPSCAPQASHRAVDDLAALPPLFTTRLHEYFPYV